MRTIVPSTFLLALLFQAPIVRSQVSDSPPIVAVFLMESRGSPLSGDELVGLTDYMATRLGEQGRFQIIPRDEIRKRLVDQKSRSYKDCVDRSCQIEIGRELAAQYTVSSSISKVGSSGLAAAVVCLSYGVTDEDLPEYVITTTGLIGATSLTLFSIDALLAYKKSGATMQASTGDREPEGFVFAPVVSPVYSSTRDGGVTGASLGLVGRF